MSVASKFKAALNATALLGLAAALSGCATSPISGPFSGLASNGCAAGLNRTATAELFFGRNIPGGGSVSDAEWQVFVDEEVTPRFPSGFTVLDAGGQWRGADGLIEREPSKMLLLVLAGAPDEANKIAAIRQAYIARFKQEAVLLVERPACAGF